MATDAINRIKVVLAEKRKTNKWLAEQLNTTVISVSRWTQNRAQPSLDKLVEIARVLGVETKDLINHNEDMNANDTSEE